MAGVPSISPAANTPSPPVQGGHEEHGGGTAITDNGAFSQALNQAIAQKSNNRGGGHGTHGREFSGTASSTTSAHPKDLSIGQGGHAGHDFQQKMLGVRAYRQQLLASNIANADTPGYKAVDIDFQEALRIARSVAKPSPLTLSATASGHISGQAQPYAPPYPLKYHIPSQASLDGNTVEMDVERSKFAENAVMYEFSLDRVSGHFKHMMEMLQNLKD